MQLQPSVGTRMRCFWCVYILSFSFVLFIFHIFLFLRSFLNEFKFEFVRRWGGGGTLAGKNMLSQRSKLFHAGIPSQALIMKCGLSFIPFHLSIFHSRYWTIRPHYRHTIMYSTSFPWQIGI